MSSSRIVRYKCPYCDKRYTREELIDHVSEEHEDLIPIGYTPFRIVFNSVNKKPLDYNGICTECKGPTKWDEAKGRYDRQCQKPSCKISYLRRFENNMMRTKGVTRISSTPEGQEKMLSHRKISGTYKFQNGAEKTYTGTYELKALHFMDKVMNINPDDLLSPGPVLNYQYNGENHFYITDFYYQPYNLVIEVKDGGTRPNKREMPEYRAKQIEKEKYIIKNTNYNYLRLTDNDLSQLLSVFADLKLQMVENTGERVIHINESKAEFCNNRHNNFIITESTKSSLDADFKPKGKKNLSSFKKIHITEEVINKYKKEYPFLKHVRCKDTKEYICDGYIWFNNNELVAMVGSCEYLDDKTKWIVSLEITEKYRGYGLSTQILDYAVKTMKCEYLSVNKNNEVAKKVYDKYGFKVYEESDTMFYMTIDKDKKYKMYKAVAEAMNALTSGYIPGISDTDSVYIVNYMKNNVFSGELESGYGISDSCKLENFITRNKEGILSKAPSNFLENCTYSVYMVKMSPEEVSAKLAPFMETFVEDGFIYEAIFGKKLYTYDQINLEENAYPVMSYSEAMRMISEAARNYCLGKSKDVNVSLLSENSVMTLDINESNNDMSCVTYMSIKDGKYYVESVDFPDLFLTSQNPMDKTSLEYKFLEGLKYRKEN